MKLKLLLSFLCFICISVMGFAQTTIVEPEESVDSMWERELLDQRRFLAPSLPYTNEALTPPVSRGWIQPQGKVREIIFNADDDQNYMTAKLYHLKHIHACDIVPYVNGALVSFGVGKAERLNYGPEKEQYLSVTTSRKMIPYIDQMVQALDRDGKRASFSDRLANYSPQKERRMTIVDGTGMFKQVYWPQYRHHKSMSDAVRTVGTVSSDGKIYYDNKHGIFSVKDSISDARRTLEFLRYLDRNLPQVELTIQVYEVNEQQARELGIDWVSWKNGPAYQMPLFGIGGTSWDGASSGIESLIETSSWVYGGIFFAPQFDASFLRLLATKNKIRTKTAARVVITNGQPATVTFDPGFQNIRKTDKDITGVYTGESQGYKFNISNPTLCFDDQTKKAVNAENIIFNYTLETNSVAGRTNTGAESLNKMKTASALTLMTGAEKPLTVYTNEVDVEQEMGWPILCDIPGLKYVFGNKKHVKSTYRYYVTVTARPVHLEQNLTPWAEDVVNATNPIVTQSKTK